MTADVDQPGDDEVGPSADVAGASAPEPVARVTTGAAAMRLRTLLALPSGTAQGSSCGRAERWVRPTTRVTDPVMRVEETQMPEPRNPDTLTIAGRDFGSRLFLGTGKFPSNPALRDAI